MTRFAAININFDSLGEAYGFPAGYRDPCFFEVSSRFLELADRHGFKYTLFVVGRDLEHPDHRAVVREWAAMGHEIGNHSWSHRVDLGALGKPAIREEVERTHWTIAEVTGEEPKGFVSPGWSTSRDLLEVLIELRYTYDTSLFPSWLIFPMLAKMIVNHVGSARLPQILRRRDYLYSLVGPRRAYTTSGRVWPRSPQDGLRDLIRVLPLPANRLRVACWHTLVFVLGWRRYERLLLSCLREVEAFYYLMHPADLLGPAEFDSSLSSHMERSGQSLEVKRRYVEQAIGAVLENGREIVTMRELAALATG